MILTPTETAIREMAESLRARFEAAGATSVDARVLLPAETLLDLYGEDIRARAYVTSDALRGEQMLRPDFTVPVMLAHLESGASEAAYTYAGAVFRRQESTLDRPNEYIQVGFELIGGDHAQTSDARVFSEIYKSISMYRLKASIGDIGILSAAVSGLRTTQRRKQALMRHIWRPTRFRALIERFSGRAEIPASRAALLERHETGQIEAPLIGLRSQAEIETRIEALREDRDTAPLSAVELEALDALLAVAGQADQALVALREIAGDLPAIGDALDRLEARLEALSAQDIDISALDFEASYGRTQMEYYDGFVFGLYDATRPDLPPIASGGRYDALTRHLGQGREAAAVGGVIRPDLLLGLQHATQNAAQGAIR